MQRPAPSLAGLGLGLLCGCSPLWLDPFSTEFTTGSGGQGATGTSESTTGASGGPEAPTTTGPGESTGAGGTSSNDPLTTGTTDPGSTTGTVCIPEAYALCDGGDVHWFDSCDVVGAVKESCGVSGPVGEATCVDGDLFSEFTTVGCEGAACTSDTGPKLIENCDEEGCSDGACVGCTYTHAVTAFECPTFSASDGDGPGGGELMEVCGTTDAQTGFMTVRARKHPGSGTPVFGDRPYQVRVSTAEGEPCSPDANFFVISDNAPAGVGTDELVFTFQSIWLPGQVEKAYCVTASTKPGDPGYDADSNLQTSWWWSQKLVLSHSCR